MSRVIKSGNVAISEPDPLNLRVIVPFLLESPTGNAAAPAEREQEEERAARERAEEIVNRAREQAEAIIADARAEAARIKEVARLDGFELGQKEGYEEGLSRAAAESEDLRKEALRLVEAAKEEAARIIAGAEPKMVQIALAVARKVIKREVAADPEIVLGNVREALRRIGRDESVTIRTSPIEVSVVHQARKELAREFEGIDEIRVEEDPSVGPGGCVVSTGRGTVDARIETQLDRVSEQLMEAVEVHGRAG